MRTLNSRPGREFIWNSTPIEIRKLDSVACFKKNMFSTIFKEQQCLHHCYHLIIFFLYKYRILFYFKCLYILAYNIY